MQRALRSEPGEIPAFAEARNQFEREYLTQLLQITHGNVTRAARIAKRNRTEFYKLLNKHHLEPSPVQGRSIMSKPGISCFFRGSPVPVQQFDP